MKNLHFNCIAVLVLFMVIFTEVQAKNDTGIQSQGDTLKATLDKAKSLVQQGNVQEANTIFLLLMKNYPNHKEPVQMWLMTNMKRSPTGEEEAIQQLAELGKMYPENTAILFFKMFIEAEYNHNEEALKDCDLLIKLQPDTAVNYVGKGQILSGMARYSEAFDAFDKATVLDPKRFDVWGMKAGTAARLGKKDAALAAADRMMALAPDHPVNYYNRACMYSLLGDKANALADLKKAIEMNPRFKQSAPRDKDFESLFQDADFKELTGQ